MFGAADVIVAPATPAGRSALAVVRLTGPGLLAVLGDLVQPRGGSLVAGRARRVDLVDDEGPIDDAVAVFGASPSTYTGEDTLELSCHGNPLVVDRLVRAAVARGCRIALPGEFTRRALVNGKLDLLQAEAVDQVCRATTAAGIAIGQQALDGRIGDFVRQVRETLLSTAAELEARLDWPGDELAMQTDDALVAGLLEVASDCRGLAATQQGGRVCVDGARVALVGPVNAGKSSLFNALLGRKRALVHAEPGTTRDVVEATGDIAGLALTLLDTAGERKTTDPVEAAGVALAAELVDEADLVVVVLRARPGGLSEVEQQILNRTADRPRLVVCNGVDAPGPVHDNALCTVAPTGRGVPALAQAIRDALLGVRPKAAGLRIASARQAELLLRVATAATEANEALPIAGVAVSADRVTEALEAIDALTGADTREDVLDALFARFCIGK